MENKKQFVITNIDGEKIEIADFTSKVQLWADLKFNKEDRNGRFGLGIEFNSNGLVNVEPGEEDPYEAKVGVNTEYLSLHLNKLASPISKNNFAFSLREEIDDDDDSIYHMNESWQEVIDCEEGVGNYFVDSYYEMENWNIQFGFEQSSQCFRLQMSANDYDDEHVGFAIDVLLKPSIIGILVKKGDKDTQESLTEFLKQYFVLDDLHISFDEYGDLRANFT